MEDFAEHYGLVVIPARPRKPRDKPHAENSVRLIYRRVFARLRNRVFFSLSELNAAIMEKVRDGIATKNRRLFYAAIFSFSNSISSICLGVLYPSGYYGSNGASHFGLTVPGITV